MRTAASRTSSAAPRTTRPSRCRTCSASHWGAPSRPRTSQRRRLPSARIGTNTAAGAPFRSVLDPDRPLRARVCAGACIQLPAPGAAVRVYADDHAGRAAARSLARRQPEAPDAVHGRRPLCRCRHARGLCLTQERTHPRPGPQVSTQSRVLMLACVRVRVRSRNRSRDGRLSTPTRARASCSSAAGRARRALGWSSATSSRTPCARTTTLKRTMPSTSRRRSRYTPGRLAPRMRAHTRADGRTRRAMTSTTRAWQSGHRPTRTSSTFSLAATTRSGRPRALVFRTRLDGLGPFS